jgi:hypothetical protein
MKVVGEIQEVLDVCVSLVLFPSARSCCPLIWFMFHHHV